MQKFALLSVSDKTGIAEFAQALVSQFEYTILSTGGTAKLLRDQGISVTDVSDHTKFPEMMDGRVKPFIRKFMVDYFACVKTPST